MQIIEKPGFMAVGVKVQGDFETLQEIMPAAWEDFYKSAKEIKHKLNEVYMDICLQEVEGVYTQFICAEVSSFEEIPVGMTYLEISEDKYLHYIHTADIMEIAASFEEMYSYSEARGYTADSFKIDYGYKEGSTETEHELYLRVIE